MLLIATIITGSDVGKADTTMSVENVTGFVPDEILFIQKVSGSGFSKEYIQVISSSNDFNSDTNFQGKLMVSRSFGSSATYNASLHSGSLSTTADTGSTYTPGQVIVSTGKLNTGYIKLNANPNDITTPYIDIVERTGSGVFDVDLKARLGDLSGLSSGLVGSSPGFGLFSENVFLTGKITATSGDIAGWEIDSNILKSGTNIQLDSGNEKITISDQTFGNTGIQLEHNSGTPRAHIGKSNGEGFKFDGTNVVMSASSFQLGNNATFVSGSNGNVKISGSSVDIQTPAFVFGDLNKAFISGSNGNLELSASNFILGTSASNAAGGNTGVGAYVSSSNNNLRISSSGFDLNSIGNVGTLNIADGKLTFDGSDLSVDGTITANDGTIGGFHIGSTSLHAGDNGIGSVNTKMVFRDITNGGVPKFSLGTSANSITLTNGDGVYMDGGGDFRVGDADGERIQFDESESELILSASAFKLGNQTSFVSGSNGNVKISGSSIDFQTPAFVLGDLNKAFISGSNGNLSMGADIFTLAATGSNDTGIMINSAQATILATGSNSVSDANSVILDGAAGVIEVSQSGDGVFDTGRTKAFTTTTFIEPQVFKPGAGRGFASSSFTVTSPTPTAENMNVISNLAVGGTIETEKLKVNSSDRSTPFTFINEFGRFNAASNTDGAVRPTASFAASQVTNYSANTIDTNCHPAFVFSADYFTELETNNNSIGWVQNGSPVSGSNIFTISNKIRETGANAPHFADGKFNVLGLETNLSQMHNTDHQNEYTFLQAKHSGSIRLQIQHDGDVVSKGNITAFGTSFLTVSDEREKKDVYQISESLDRILNLRPTKFTWKETDKQDVGFIAQEVEKIIPEVIETSRGFINTDDSKERKTIAYPKLVPYLVDTIQELTKRIEELEKKVK